METMESKRKSVALTKEDWKGLKSYRAKFLSSVECAEAIGIERGPLDRVLLLGRGAPYTIDRIKKAIGINEAERA